MTEADQRIIFLLAQKLTGVHPEGTYHHAIFLTNIQRRIRERGLSNLTDYLKLVERDPAEHAQLVSALSIHTTGWFRENPHTVIFQQVLLERMKQNTKFKVWSAACSTGEEVYTFALLMEEFRRFHPRFQYSILGTDIDPISLEKARQAVYPKKGLTGPITHYKSHILLGSGVTQDFFTFTKTIRERCTFQKHDIREPLKSGEKFDVVICRNVLIYFTPDQARRSVGFLLNNMTEEGLLMLGHSEMISHQELKLRPLGHSAFRRLKVEQMSKSDLGAASSSGASPSRVLVVDDSRTFREYLKKAFEKAGMKVIVAETSSEASKRVSSGEKFDLVTLDINMPGQAGDDWLRAQRSSGFRTPIVIISNTHASQTNALMQLLSDGAQAYIEKEDLSKSPDLLLKTIEPLIETFRRNQRGSENSQKSSAKIQRRPPAAFKPDLILIGASTGGPNALAIVMKSLPSHCPPILLVQHIAPKFGEPFAQRMAEISGLRLGKMENGEVLKPGHVYSAIGDYHIGLKQDSEGVKLALSQDPPRNGHRPSVDHLFFSASKIKCSKMAILLTGMGKDGAEGLKELHGGGAYTLAQSEEDCVVFGMPKEAIARNAVDYVGDCSEIRREIAVLTDLIRAAGF